MRISRGGFPAAVGGALAEHEADAGEALAVDEQGKERHRAIDLIVRNQARQPALLGRLAGGQGEERQVHIGVPVDMVRVGMMPVVLLHPPSVTAAGEQVAADDPHQRILPAAHEALPVPRIVDDKRQLDGYYAQEERAEDDAQRAMKGGQEGDAGNQQGGSDEEIDAEGARLGLQ